MRIAFTLFAGRNWLGGYNYLVNLCRTIKQFSGGSMIPVMFVGDDVEESDLFPFRDAGCEIVVSSNFNQDKKLRRLLSAILLGKDSLSERLFLQNNIDAVFEHATYFGWCFGLPVIAWLGDFQHRHFPAMFSWLAFWKRELGMQIQIRSGRIVMVSSEMAARDCKRFFGLASDRVYVVRFAVSIPPTRELNEVQERYGLPPFFFHLPNQFWKHKNHTLVINALSLLKDENIFIVATGRCEDLRHPEYFHKIEKLIRAEKLENNFRILGVVPYPDLVDLMHTSLAIINPSLFEGWSTTVEEARSIGVPLLLSDIPVHREQMGHHAQYFSVNAPEQLASLLKQCLAEANLKRIFPKKEVKISNKFYMERFFSEFERVVLASVSEKRL